MNYDELLKWAVKSIRKWPQLETGNSICPPTGVKWRYVPANGWTLDEQVFEGHWIDAKKEAKKDSATKKQEDFQKSLVENGRVQVTVSIPMEKRAELKEIARRWREG